MDKKHDDRGRITQIKLSKSITLNRQKITRAVIEIDHINHGLNEKTKKLNEKARTSFSVKDVEKFLKLLDGEELAANSYHGMKSRFSFRVDCPVKGEFFGKEFLMIFTLDYKVPDEVYTVTLIPYWKKGEL